jgi:hypothetical protein
VNVGWVDEIVATLASVAVAVAPLVVLFVIVQIFLLRLPRSTVVEILVGTLISATGLFVFLLGIGIGFLPYGRVVGEALGVLQDPWLLAFIGLFLGFLTTWGEPAVRILAKQVELASNGSIRKTLVLYAVCIGVALWVAIGLLRIYYSISLIYLIGPGYLLVICLVWFGDRDFVAIAVDAGGVATGPLANTFLLAVALGASAAMGDRDPLVDGLGFVALIALAPIVSVVMLGILIRVKTRVRE